MLSETLDKSTLPKPRTKPPNHKTRYIAAIVATVTEISFKDGPLHRPKDPKEHLLNVQNKFV